MEILDALEQKVNAVLDELTTLRQRNIELERLVQEMQAKEGRTVELETALSQTRSQCDLFSSRVESLVHRLEEQGITK